MKTIVFIALGVLLFGCEEATPPQAGGAAVSVGMAYQDAEPLLSGNGAMHMEIDTIQDSDTHIREVNRFPNGTLVLIEISLESRCITDLKICVDPNQPGTELAWKSVKTFYPGVD